MARMLTQVPLPLLPGDAAEIAPGVGVVACPDGGGVVWVHGWPFAWDAGDEAARRLAAVQLPVQLKAATQVQVAQAFGVIPVSVWRWARALAGGGIAGLVPAARGPQQASKLTPQVVARIRELDGRGAGKAAITTAAGVSESSVRSIVSQLRQAAGGQDAGGAGEHPAGRAPRSRSWRCCRTRCPGTPSGRWPGSGCWAGGRRAGIHAGRALPAGRAAARAAAAGAVRAAGLRPASIRAAAERVLRPGGGHAGRAGVRGLLREARAEGATRIPPDALGRVLGLDRATEVKTIRRNCAELHHRRQGRGPAAGAGPPPRTRQANQDTLGFLYIDGHTRAYFGKRDIQKMHVTRLKLPGPATEETWVTGSAGEPTAGRDGPAVLLPGRPDPRPAARAARGVGPARSQPWCFDRGAAGARPCSPTSPTPGSTC